ncbi:MAG: hypothetical protein ACD_56C00069G0006 [uncultured bacterium]|nr:MAG: hypothetical protein ACD_56C00069G0006 [uncultured bacterium]
MIDPSFHENFREVGFIMSSVKNGSYFAIFALSILVSFVIPLPEAVALLLFGFIGATSQLDIQTIFAVAFLGSIVGDNGLYRLSFAGNAWVERFNRKMRRHKLIKYENLVVGNINKTIYFLRLITGVRFFGPMIAGTLGIGWRKFFLANFGATFINVAIFVSLGYYLHQNILSLIAEVEIVRNLLLFSSAVIVGFLLNIFSRK